MSEESILVNTQDKGDGFLIGPAPSHEYWGELGKAEFQDLLDKLTICEDFDLGIMDYFDAHKRRDLYVYITDLIGRGAWYRLLRSPNRGVAVDLGAGLGAISEFLCQRYQNVFSIEGCKERCQFLALRKERKKLVNQQVIHSNIYELPFRDNTVDLVVCNGLLEWVALGRGGPVPKVQRDFLREIRRILAPDGILYIGIENRFARTYLHGTPDHSGLKYTSWVPRFIANWMTRKPSENRGFSFDSSHGTYRTYTYSALGYGALLRRAGLLNFQFFCAEPSYDIPKMAYPLKADRKILSRFFDVFTKRPYQWRVDKALCSNYFIFASKSTLNEKVESEPLYFGYYDYLCRINNHIERKSVAGGIRREAISQGDTAIATNASWIRSEHISEVFDSFLASDNVVIGRDDADKTCNLIDLLCKSWIDKETIDRLKLLVTSNHIGKPYHGDLWVGNIVIAEGTRNLTLIDSEPHLFGSPMLDVVDFVTEFAIRNRIGRFPNINVKQILNYYDINPEDRALFLLGLVRQVIRYTPFHRSHVLVYEYRSLAQRYASGENVIDLH